MMPLCIFLALLCEICEYLTHLFTLLFWYQQSLGGKPQIISTQMKHSPKVDITPAYKERFHVVSQSQEGINNLIITDLQLLDSATYYCGVLLFDAIEFGQGVFLQVKPLPSYIQPAVHQSALEPFRLGDSVNLSCTVYAEPCAGEQSLYWFKHGESQPAVVYPSDGECTSLSNEKPHGKNCTLHLAIKSVSSSDAGTYYCALASCGEIVFGGGVEIAGPAKVPPLLVYGLSVALAVSIIMLLVSTFIMYKVKKKLCSVCKGTVSHRMCSAPSEVASQDADSLHYAALSLRNSGQHHQEINMESVCVYSRVKIRKQ